MSLASKLEAAKPVFKPKFEQWIDTLSDEDQKALVAAAKDPGWTSAALLRLIQSEGARVGHTSFTVWRDRVRAG